MELNEEASKRCKVDDDEKRQNADRISQLPEPIMHQILERLPTKEAARTCCLSKTWNTVWNSSPGLYFNQTSFRGYRVFKGYKTQLAEFCNYIDQRIKDRRQSNITINKFQLSLDVKGIRNRVSWEYFRKWLDYAINDNELHQLVAHCHDKSPAQDSYWDSSKQLLPYLLPEFLFSAKSLKELDLLGCRIDTNTNFNLHSLKRLSLARVSLDHKALESLFSSCCLVEQVSINKCTGFSTVKLPCLIKLKKLVFVTSNTEQIIKITAPNLLVITYGGEYNDVESFIAGCDSRKVDVLIFDNANLHCNFLRYIRSRFPKLWKMEFRKCLLKDHQGYQRYFECKSVRGRFSIREFCNSPPLK